MRTTKRGAQADEARLSTPAAGNAVGTSAAGATASTATAATTDLTVDVVTGSARLDALRDEWRTATAVDPRPNVFLTWEWVRTWWAHFACRAQLHVVVVRDPRGLVAIAPLQRRRIGVGPLATVVLQCVTTGAGDYGGIVTVRRAADAVDAVVGHLDSELHARRIGAVVLSRLLTDDPGLGHLRAAVDRRDGSPVVTETVLRGAGHVAEVANGFNLARPLRRYKLRERLAELRVRHAEATFTDHAPGDLDRGFDLLAHLQARGRSAPGTGTLRPSGDAGREAFLVDLLRTFDEQNRVRLVSLTAGDRPIAAALHLAHGDRLFQLRRAHDPAFAASMPDQLVRLHVIEEALAAGFRSFDFGRCGGTEERHWATGVHPLVTLTMTRPGRSGRLAAQRLRAAHTP